jgi:hypothetical protein
MARVRFTILAMVLAACVFVPAGTAAAQNCGGNAPGGNSEVDQYSETVPNGCGDRPVNEGGPGNQDAVPPGTATELQQLGPDGEAALALARGNAPEGNGDGGGSAAGDRATGGDDSGLGDILGSILDAFGGSTEDDGGMGIWLPLLIVAILLAGAVYGLRRRLG